MIQGQAYTRQGPLEGPLNPLDQADHHPVNAQLYLYDPGEATTERVRTHADLDAAILRRLDYSIRDTNPLVPAYSTAREILQSHPYHHGSRVRINHDLNIRLFPGRNQNVASLPIAGEVAALLLENRQGEGPLGVRLFLRAPLNGGHGATIIPSSDPHHWALCYPLFFPHGDRAWHWSLRLDTFPLPSATQNQPP